MRRDGIALKKMPNGRDFNLPGPAEALSLDVSIPDLSVFVSYLRHGSVDVLKFSNSKSKPELLLAGQILKLQVCFNFFFFFFLANKMQGTGLPTSTVGGRLGLSKQLHKSLNTVG